jgi:hypothetical protein
MNPSAAERELPPQEGLTRIPRGCQWANRADLRRARRPGCRAAGRAPRGRQAPRPGDAPRACGTGRSGCSRPSSGRCPAPALPGGSSGLGERGRDVAFPGGQRGQLAAVSRPLAGAGASAVDQRPHGLRVDHDIALADQGSRPKLSSSWPPAIRCLAAAFSTSSPASSCAEPVRSIFREPRPQVTVPERAPKLVPVRAGCCTSLVYRPPS